LIPDGRAGWKRGDVKLGQIGTESRVVGGKREKKAKRASGTWGDAESERSLTKGGEIMVGRSVDIESQQSL